MGALAAARRLFPNARLHLLLAQFSHTLTAAQTTNLTTINQYLTAAVDKPNSRCHLLPRIPPEDFHTKPDCIHWTPTTAATFLQTWIHHILSDHPLPATPLPQGN